MLIIFDEDVPAHRTQGDPSNFGDFLSGAGDDLGALLSKYKFFCCKAEPQGAKHK